MSDTEVSRFPTLSEATDNDVRPDPVPDTSFATEGPAPEPEQAEALTEPPAEPAEPEPQAELEAEDAEAEANRAKKLARDLRETKRRLHQQELEIQALRGQRQEAPDEATMRLVDQRARETAHWNDVNAKCNDIYEQGVKEFGRVGFEEATVAIRQAFGQSIPTFLETIVDLPNAAKLLSHLGDNPDLLDSIATLPPHRAGAALAREAEKLSPKPKPQSKAPPPIRPIATQATTEGETDMSKWTVAQHAKAWDEQERRRRMNGR